MARRCTLTGKRPNVANKVSHSNIKTKKRQFPNLQKRRLWYVEGGRFITIRISTSALRTLNKIGLHEFAARSGVDLAKL